MTDKPKKLIRQEGDALRFDASEALTDERKKILHGDPVRMAEALAKFRRKIAALEEQTRREKQERDE